MEFIREYFEEESGKYVLEFNATEEEKRRLDEYCERNAITLDQAVERFIEDCLNGPGFEQISKELLQEKKFPKGVIGKPKCKIGDIVGSYIIPYGEEKEIFFSGKVEIVDAYGTFEQNEEPSYDIFVENFNGGGETLVKHVRESSCYDLREN